MPEGGMCYLSGVDVERMNSAMAPVLGLASSFRGWVPDRNKRIVQVRTFTLNLRSFANAELSYHRFESSTDEEGLEREKFEYDKVFETLKNIRGLHSFLEQAMRGAMGLHLPTPVKVEVISQFQAAIAKAKDMMATLSYACGENDYRELGFEVLPKVVEPQVPADLSDLFADAS